SVIPFARPRAGLLFTGDKMKKGLLLLSVLALSACDVNDADVASRNVSKAADNFEAQRRFVFYNGITGEFMLEITGLCSKDNTSTDRTLGVICKTGPGVYKKHMLGLSDNVTWFMEDLSGTNASVNHYRVTFKPSVIIPDIDIR
ncbi:TPA: hypothetical protein ACOEG6_004793, partial [Enterobacter bugandensis]